jgi:hypothetical protein
VGNSGQKEAMMRIEASAEEVELEGDHGPVMGLVVTCSRCGHEVEVFGTSDASARRGGVMLSEECPERERNFYVVDEGDDYGPSPQEAFEAYLRQRKG